MQLQDLDALKDLPGYRAILRAVLKTQIQHLVQQLSEQTEEESMILTASLSDGTLCLLGSSSGHDFLDGRDEIKSQFLRHCLERHHSNGPNDTAVSHQDKEWSSDFTARNRPSSRGAFKSRSSSTRIRPYHIHNRSRDSPPAAGSFLPATTNTTDVQYGATDVQYGVGTPEQLSSRVGTSASIKDRNTSGRDMSESKIELKGVTDQIQYSDSHSGNTSVDQSEENSEKTLVETQSTNESGLNIELMTGSAVIDSSETDSAAVERTQSEYGVTVVKREAVEEGDDELSIVHVEPGSAGDQALYGADWSQNIGTHSQYFSGNHSTASLPGSDMQQIMDGSMQEQPSPMYRSASTKTKGGHSGCDSPVVLSPALLYKLCAATADGPLRVDGSLPEQRKRFPCSECYKSFTQRCDLKRHMTIHTGERFHCSVCPKSFSQKHQHEVPSSLKVPTTRIPCHLCSKLISHHNMNKHLNIHSGVRRFKCDLCNMAFFQGPDLRRHKLARHHVVDGHAVVRNKFTR